MKSALDVQRKEVLKDLNIKVVYAMSPTAKGKVERAYQWLQDYLVRTCVREGITTIDRARQVLYEELHQYNYKRVYSTTGKIPFLRYEKAIEENRSLFRRFEIPRPYQTLDDIFCYRFKRMVNPYRKVSRATLKFSLSGVPIRDEVELRISFNLKTRLALIRFWYPDKLVGQQQVKAEDLKKVRF